VPVVLAVAKGRAVALTGRSLAPALELIGGGGLLPAEDHQFLATFHADVMASLTAPAGGGGGGGGGDDVNDDDEEEEEEDANEGAGAAGGASGDEKVAVKLSLAERLPELKRIALQCKKPKGGAGGGDDE
jgi:hypothetical protein